MGISAVVTRTMVMVRVQEGHVSVSDARTNKSTMTVTWGDVIMRFTSAAQVHAMLAAFAAVRAALRGIPGNVPTRTDPDGNPWLSVVSIAWLETPTWVVVPQSRYDEKRRTTAHYVDIHMGPVLWRIVDWAGYESALALLRNAHRTAVAVFSDGGKFRTDPTTIDVISEVFGSDTESAEAFQAKGRTRRAARSVDKKSAGTCS